MSTDLASVLLYVCNVFTQEDIDHKIVVPESLRRSDWIIDESTS